MIREITDEKQKFETVQLIAPELDFTRDEVVSGVNGDEFVLAWYLRGVNHLRCISCSCLSAEDFAVLQVFIQDQIENDELLNRALRAVEEHAAGAPNLFDGP